MWCWSPSRKRHIRPLHVNGSLFFRSPGSPQRRVLNWLDESDSPTCCERQTLFTQDLTIDNSCKESDASNKKRNSLIFFTFLYMVPIPSPNLISYPVKNSKFQVVCCLSRRKYQPTKICFASTATSVEPWKVLSREWLKIVRIFSQIPHYCIEDAAGHSCFSIRTNILTSAQDFFSCLQTPNQKIQINSKGNNLFTLIIKMLILRELTFWLSE